MNSYDMDEKTNTYTVLYYIIAILTCKSIKRGPLYFVRIILRHAEISGRIANFKYEKVQVLAEDVNFL